MDMQIQVLALPTPEGYAGLIQFSNGLAEEPVRAQLQLLADYTLVSYRGSLTQWRGFLGAKERPPEWAHLAVLARDEQSGLSLRLPALSLRIAPEVVKVADTHNLRLISAFVPRGDALAWEILGVGLYGKASEDSFVEVLGQPRPGSGAGTRLRERWDKLAARQGEYAGEPRYTPQFDQFWTRSVLGDSGGERLFEVVLNIREKGLLPRQVTERRDRLVAGITLASGTP
jgi:hypothetical protein